MPTAFEGRLHVASITQGPSSVANYRAYFNELLLRCDLDEDLNFTLARFKNGLRPKICRVLAAYKLDSLDQVFQ